MKWAKKCYKQTFFRIMVPTQALIKASQSLLQVIFCTTPACENAWTTTSPLFTSFNFLNDGDSSGNEFYRTSFLVKKRKESCDLLFTSPIKHETFQAVVGQQRSRTKMRDARANLAVVHDPFCRHFICLSSPLFESSLTTSVLRVAQRLEILSLTERRSILFSGIYLSGCKTPIGPVAGHAKNPILPFGLGLNFLLSFFRQRFLK